MKTSIDNSANNSLFNLTPAGKNIGNWSTNVSNCITQIPQDIKLELNAGTLTLKAGSKVYVPNGAGVFDTITISSDLNLGAIGSYTGSGLLFVKNDGTQLIQQVSNISGTTPPSGDGSWYDTTNNLIKVYSSGTDSGVRMSFPIAVIHRTSGTWDDIEQIFNGVGYIGSTAFILPDVKGLIPNGRNADGTLKSIEFSIPNVATLTESNVNDYTFVTNGTAIGNSTIRKYDAEKNYVINTNTNVPVSECIIGYFHRTTGGVISSFFKPKYAFHALDYNDKLTISSWGMPNYAAGASRTVGTEYTAGQNGWVKFYGGGGGVGGTGANGGYRVTINGTQMDFSYTSGEANTRITTMLPVVRGTKYKGSLMGGATEALTITWYPCIGG